MHFYFCRACAPPESRKLDVFRAAWSRGEPTEPDHRLIGESLLAEATAMGAGVLIIGAYTHSRLRRMIFGSVTGHMLSTAEIPVVMMN